MAKKKRRIVLHLCIIAAALLAGVAVGLLIKEKPPETVSRISTNVSSASNISNVSILSLEGFVVANISIEGTDIVVMQTPCYRITALTTEAQAYSLELGLKNQTGSRPTTHDLMRDVFEILGIKILQAKITGYDESVSTYLGRLVLQQGDKILDLDSRPTDVIGVASRMNVPIYINESMVKTRGKKIC